MFKGSLKGGEGLPVLCPLRRRFRDAGVPSFSRIAGAKTRPSSEVTTPPRYRDGDRDLVREVESESLSEAAVPGLSTVILFLLTYCDVRPKGRKALERRRFWRFNQAMMEASRVFTGLHLQLR